MNLSIILRTIGFLMISFFAGSAVMAETDKASHDQEQTLQTQNENGDEELSDDDIVDED